MKGNSGVKIELECVDDKDSMYYYLNLFGDNCNNVYIFIFFVEF